MVGSIVQLTQEVKAVDRRQYKSGDVVLTTDTPFLVLGEWDDKVDLNCPGRRVGDEHIVLNVPRRYVIEAGDKVLSKARKRRAGSKGVDSGRAACTHKRQRFGV